MLHEMTEDDFMNEHVRTSLILVLLGYVRTDRYNCCGIKAHWLNKGKKDRQIDIK